MAHVGNLGSLITFEVSSNKVLTFNNMQQTVSGRWATHDLIHCKPMPEYLGPGQRKVTLTVFISALHGVRPRQTIERLEEAAENGTPYTFVINGRKVGSYQWVVESISETWDEIIEGGRLVSAHLTLSLAEYYE